MIVHLYAQCWNDEWMLPFFFRHYDPLVDRYFIYDDGSTDATRSLLEAHPNVEPRRFVRADPDSFALSEQAFSNECWKQSRGEADWVIVTDIDEHLVHPAGRDYLALCSAADLTLIPALGFQMISERPPKPEETLAREYRLGAPQAYWIKPSIFDPDAIDEISFRPGRHRADPSGRVEVPGTDEMMLFHYKYMGFQQTLARHRMLRTGMRSKDLESGYGSQYFWSENELRAKWDDVAKHAVDTAAVVRDPGWRYPLKLWWERYRRRAAFPLMRSVEEVTAAAASVPGWTDGEDARKVALASLALPDEATIVETGVYMGRCTVLLAGARSLRGSGRVHCVDPFDCSGDPFSVPHYLSKLEATGIASLEEAFRRNIARLGLDPWIEVHKGTDLEIAAGWSQPIDLLLLDGDQSPAGARAAYEAWSPFLRRGGTIVLRNTGERQYAEGHDGHQRLVVEEIRPPRYRDIRQVGMTTFATKES